MPTEETTLSPEEKNERRLNTVELIKSGDVDLGKARSAYFDDRQKSSVLTDDQMIDVFSSQDDDYGMSDIVNRMIALEDGRPLNYSGRQG